MVNILIVSYHFPPLNHIASFRTRALAQFLHEHGIYPTVVTHDWQEDSQLGTEGIKEEDFGTHKVIRLPHTSSKYRVDRAGKAQLIWDWIRGDFDHRGTMRESGLIFEKFLHDFLRNHNGGFDLILGIYSPFFPLRLAHNLSRQFHIPYAADFRDLIDNRQLSTFHIPIAERLRNWFVHRHLRKWLRKALFISTTSEKWARHLTAVVGVKGYEITNGYEEEMLSSQKDPDTFERFEVSSVGTLYANQKMEIFIEGFRQFAAAVDRPKDLHLNFIGVRESYRPQAISELRNGLPSDVSLHIENRVSKSQAISHLKKSQILLFPTPVGYFGYFTGKIFEYLGVRRNILAFPDDGEVASQLIQDTKAGVVVGSAEEISTYLYAKYQEWRERGQCEWHGDITKIQQYSRAATVQRLASVIGQHLPQQ